MFTTLNAIRKHKPCTDGWQQLLAYLGKTSADDEPLEITTILDSNGLQDALWCLRAVEGYDREIRLFAVWCARQAQHLMTDQRSLDAMDVAERYANGEATQYELNAARSAGVAAMDAVGAAWSAADARSDAWSAAAARAAATTAARAAARAAATAAARVAATAAARAAAESAAAAWGDARAKQEAELRRICGE